jgi:adenylosuccinate synthase
MPVTVVVGAQWGDEGKGRIVDWLARRADMVIRYQGGDNAGHTVVNDAGRFALHMVPSGIFNPETTCIVGAGTVVSPDGLLKEIESLEQANVSTRGLLLDERAHVVLPTHRHLDGLQEEARKGDARIGTTRRGIGPAYADKAARTGLRLGDLVRPATLAAKVDRALDRLNPQIEALGGAPEEAEALVRQLKLWGEALGDRIGDTLPIMYGCLDSGRSILLEGQLGGMRDLDWGTWPYVTSSNTVAGAAAVGSGLPPRAIERVIGVMKAYCTAVGAGPFPTEEHGDTGDRLRAFGQEYGATTGRPRRCGWFDAVALRQAARLSGFTHLALTKLDVLAGFEHLRVGVGYTLDGRAIDHVPWPEDYARVEAVYEDHEGWQSAVSRARTWEELPLKARTYVHRLAELAGNIPLAFTSVGPARDQLIVQDWP